MIPLICGLCGNDFKKSYSMEMTFTINARPTIPYTVDIDGHLNYEGEFISEEGSPVSYDSVNGPFCKTCHYKVEEGYVLRGACLNPIEDIILKINVKDVIIRNIHHYRIEHGGGIIKEYLPDFIKRIEDEYYYEKYIKKLD
jgi:hypothetical protein